MPTQGEAAMRAIVYTARLTPSASVLGTVLNTVRT